MKDTFESRMLRRLRGDLSPQEEASFDDRRAADAELDRRCRQWERTWRTLGVAGVEGAPPGFAARVASRAVGDAAPMPTAWRWAAAAAGALGVALGVGAVSWAGPTEALLPTGGPTLASGYVELLAAEGETDGEGTP